MKKKAKTEALAQQGSEEVSKKGLYMSVVFYTAETHVNGSSCRDVGLDVDGDRLMHMYFRLDKEKLDLIDSLRSE